MIHKKVETTTISVRGHFLEMAIRLEMVINFFLSKHFSKDEKTDTQLFHHLFITERISFASKVELFDVVIREGYEEFKTENPKYFEDLITIVKDRNVFAHSHIDFTNDGLVHNSEGRLALTRYDKKKLTKIVVYSDDAVKAKMDLIYEYTDKISLLVVLNR